MLHDPKTLGSLHPALMDCTQKAAVEEAVEKRKLFSDVSIQELANFLNQEIHRHNRKGRRTTNCFKLGYDIKR